MQNNRKDLKVHICGNHSLEIQIILGQILHTTLQNIFQKSYMNY